MKHPSLLPIALLLLPGITACRERTPFTLAMKLGGQMVDAKELEEGYAVYAHHCRPCHGDKGDGEGPSAPGMRPPPRDFTVGVFKFAGVQAGELPNDDDLIALVKRGLDGTPMLPWDISDRERHAVIQYIKTFSERWNSETPGERIVPAGPDSWANKDAEAIELGKALYHLSGASLEKDAQGAPVRFFMSCNICHPSYLPRAEIAGLSRKLASAPPTESRTHANRPELKASDYSVGTQKISFLPPDFLFHRIKNGTSLQSIYRTIAAGIPGTAMPSWSAMKSADLWALAHYVRRLALLRNTPQADALRAVLSRDE